MITCFEQLSQKLSITLVGLHVRLCNSDCIRLKAYCADMGGNVVFSHKTDFFSCGFYMSRLGQGVRLIVSLQFPPGI